MKTGLVGYKLIGNELVTVKLSEETITMFINNEVV